MMGRNRPQPPQQQSVPPPLAPQQKAGAKPPVGVRLMQEPGFAAHDSHLYRRRLVYPSPPESHDPGSEREARSLTAGAYDPQNGCGVIPPTAVRIRDYAGQSGNRLEAYPTAPQHQERSSTRDNPSHRRRRTKASHTGIPLEGVRLATDFRAAVSRFSRPVPQSLIKALSARDYTPSIGKVHVSLRVTPTIPIQKGEISIISLDKKRRQVTILDQQRSSFTQERVGVSAPKMFAFDQLHSNEDDQASVVGKVLPDILQAVLGGTDGCITCFGGSGMGKTQTMVGSHVSSGELGIMPTAISWLYQAIAHLKANKASRFSVRVSAVVVDAPGKEVADVLGDFSQDNETSPGALLRQGSGLLSSVSELRAPFPEIAARYLDLALSARAALSSSSSSRSRSGPATLLFTLHIYQYTFDKKEKGRVVGGRSRLHLIDLGDMSGNHSESLSLSGLTSVLLAIFNGHKYLPHKFNRLTQLLQEILGSVTCHAAIIVHISPSQRHSQHTLATLQLASRVHRLRRKKIRGLGGSSGSGGSSEGSRKKSSGGETSAGSSSVDFSSSEQSADTVIYIGGGGPGDSSDGEHPPIFFPHHIRRHRSVELPRLRSFEQLRPHTASPRPVIPKRPVSVSPTPTSRSVPIDRVKPKPPPRHNSTRSLSNSSSFVSSPIQTGFFRHQPGVSQVIYPNEGSREPLANSSLDVLSPSDKEPAVAKRTTLEGDKQPSYKYYQQPNTMVPIFQNFQTPSAVATSCSRQQHSQEVYLHNQTHISCSNSQQRKQCTDNHSSQSTKSHSKENSQHLSRNTATDIPRSDEQWIDGPRISKSKVNAAKNKLCQSETWVDGPSMEKGAPISYGFMDDHKKTMIERWVENQTAQVVTHVGETKQPQPSKSELHESRVAAACATNTCSSAANADEINLESDVDTLSEDHSSNLAPADAKQPDLIEELERKNLIPVQNTTTECQKHELPPTKNKEKPDSSTEECHVTDVEDICSQCQALEEDCEAEELNSLLSCEEEECKRQTQNHNGLETVLEEPELESAFGGDDPNDPIDSMSLLNNPQTDCEDTDPGGTSEMESSEIRTLQQHQWCPFDNARPEKALVALPKMADSGVQVCEEDILRTLSNTPCPSEMTTDTSDDHPLRVLSEENLTCASTFTDSNSQIGETGDEDDSETEEDSRPFSLFEATEYGRICQDLTAALQSEAADKDLHELANIHRLFSAFTRNTPNTQPESLFNPVLFQSVLDNQEQPKSLPLPSDLNESRVKQDRTVIVSKELCAQCNSNIKEGKTTPDSPMVSTGTCVSQEVSPLRENSNESLRDSEGQDKTLRYSLDKCTGTDDTADDNYSDDDGSCNEKGSSTPLSYYHSSETLIDEGSAKQQKNVNGLGTNTSPSLKSSDKTINTSSFEEVLPKYLNDGEHNLVLFDQVSFACKNCERNFESCDIHDSIKSKYENDSDCPSSVSEDSEYIIQNSKFSKFLCVGIGRSKSKSAIKSNKTISKSSDSKKNIFKIRDSKSAKNQKTKEITKSPDHISKNLIRSPCRIHSPDKSELEVETPPNIRLEVERKREEISSSDLKCHCIKNRCPESPHYPSKLEYSAGTSSTSGSSKDWGVSPLSLLSPQLCPAGTPTIGGVQKNASHSMITSGSLGTTQSLGESSGYESIPRDSECSSFSSSQESEMDEEHRKFISHAHPLKSVPGALGPLVSTSSVESDVRGGFKGQNSFLKHLTKKNSSSKSEAKLVSSTTWKYRC